MPWTTSTLARTHASLSLIYACRSNLVDTYRATSYFRLARAAFTSDDLREASLSDLAWGMLTEGIILAGHAAWDRALEVLDAAKELLQKLHAVRLWELCRAYR